MSYGLTARQRQILEAFNRLERDQGVPPTFRELADSVGITSTNGIKCHLRALERKGMITQEPIISRGIRLTIAARQLLGTIDSNAIWETPRLLIYRMAYQLPMFAPRDLFIGFLKDPGFNAAPVVTMTVDSRSTPPTVNWLQTHDYLRGKGFATELWLGVERLNSGPLQGAPATDDGLRFFKRLETTRAAMRKAKP